VVPVLRPRKVPEKKKQDGNEGYRLTPKIKNGSREIVDIAPSSI
jgi:hypothetical protein